MLLLGWIFFALHHCNWCILARRFALDSIEQEIHTSKSVRKLIIHMIGTLGHHNIQFLRNWDKLDQREHPLAWPTLILKDFSAILQYFPSLTLSCMLVNKCNKCVSYILLFLVRLDWSSIFCCNCCILNEENWRLSLLAPYTHNHALQSIIYLSSSVVPHWAQYPIHRGHRTIVYLFHQQSDVENWQKICPLDDSKCLADLWHVRYIIYLSLYQDHPPLLKVLEYIRSNYIMFLVIALPTFL